MTHLEKVISGGQTGADRAALDAVMSVGIPSGGWCPKGRRAEDGDIPPRYPLRETPEEAVEQRTEWNVRDSDGTLILVLGEQDQGTQYTVEQADQYNRPTLTVTLPAASGDVERAASWLKNESIQVLNVAGPRESNAPGLYEHARTFLESLFRRCVRR
ncbi:molybdenum cofactor carrier [Longibacter salinarum]|uniref:Molybdenum cofactor carrier n=1 Tax=Longibacter salinarum TaxID=1850348 RepID=A0A2A8D335_9BACT|nr:putative molybdenum carrier protein [Longibacter salinarum]PEN15227.1 molybdenum cofactor carrier [Longibacter salinarum]